MDVSSGSVCLALYRMRTLSWKVILILDAVYLAAVLLLSQDITCSAGMMEAFLLSIVILFLAIKRGILPGKKRLLYLAADGLPDGKGETGYIASNIQQEQHGFSLLGGGKISEALLLPQIKITGHGPCHRRAVQPTLFTAFSCGLVSLWEYW